MAGMWRHVPLMEAIQLWNKRIEAGTYRANSQVPSQCYWEITVNNGADIVQNDIPGGGYPQVTVSDGQQLKLQDCGTWSRQ